MQALHQAVDLPWRLYRANPQGAQSEGPYPPCQDVEGWSRRSTSQRETAKQARSGLECGQQGVDCRGGSILSYCYYRQSEECNLGQTHTTARHTETTGKYAFYALVNATPLRTEISTTSSDCFALFSRPMKKYSCSDAGLP